MDESTEFDCPMVDGKLVSKALTYTSFWNLGISTVSIPADIKPEEILVKSKLFPSTQLTFSCTD